MKSHEAVSMSAIARVRRDRRRTWFVDDEPTAEIPLLGSLVREPAHTVTEQEPLGVAQRILIERRVPAVAVVRGEQLCGVVTRTDVLRLVATRDDARIADAMSGFVFALRASATVEAAAALMAIEQVGQVVVTSRDGELLGMVSALDVARYFAERAGYVSK
ncbi:MAG TPA: CBS domain-containing protein [Kofleriaceae bacterium]|nr:CBS domain-containing protein [Kofleriaceae bacterium]